MKSAYLVPYYVQNQKVYFLYNQKQVISYDAVANLKKKISHKEKSSFLNAIKYGKTVIAEDGKTIGFSGKRFAGALLPAGGKASFFGGHCDNNKDYDLKDTAIREFKEESGLSFKIKKNILHEIYKTNWGGVYYAVDLMEMKQQDWAKVVEKKNYQFFA